MGDGKNHTQEDKVTHGTKKYNNRRNKHEQEHKKYTYTEETRTRKAHTIYATDKRGRNKSGT